MSFGFSVSDFIAVGNLIAKSIDTLRNTQSEYQELIRELENLNRALKQVDKLKSHGDQADAINEIKCAALTCRYPIEQFLFKIQKYEKSLGLGKSVNKIKEVGRKVQYALEKKNEANRLRHYLNLHIGIIDTLMLQNSLERLDVASERSREIKDRVESYSRELKEVNGNVEAQVFAVRETKSLIYKLFSMVSGEVAAPLKALSQTVAKVSASTQQIYAIMLEVKTNLLGIDTRFTYFQAPVKVDDALGRVFPFPSECSIEALNTEIRSRFKKGPGKIEVLAGDFELFNAKNAKQIFTISDDNGLLPGMSINMAIILEKEFAEGDKCPMPHCISKTFVEAVGGGKTCSECGVWFDKATKKRKRGFEREERLKHVETLAYPQHSEAERRMIGEDTSITAFKRIKCGDRASDMSRRQEESHEATEVDSMSKEGETGREVEEEAARANKMRAEGADMGSMPHPTPIRDKRPYTYNGTKHTQRTKHTHRPLAPSIEGIESENGSSKLRWTKSQPRFKQGPPKYTTLAEAEQGAAAVSSQREAQEREMQARQQAHEAARYT